MDHRLQQFFVAEHNSSFPSCSNAFWGEPLTHVACLDIFSRCRDISQCFWGQFFCILIENGLACLFQSSEECLFHFLQMIKAHKGIGVVTEVDVRSLHHLTIESPLITEILTGQSFVEKMIDVADTTP